MLQVCEWCCILWPVPEYCIIGCCRFASGVVYYGLSLSTVLLDVVGLRVVLYTMACPWVLYYWMLQVCEWCCILWPVPEYCNIGCCRFASGVVYYGLSLSTVLLDVVGLQVVLYTMACPWVHPPWLAINMWTSSSAGQSRPPPTSWRSLYCRSKFQIIQLLECWYTI